MKAQRQHRPGDIILDRYVPELGPEQREEARGQLYRFVAWQMRILVRQVRCGAADSRDDDARDTLDTANPP